MGLFKKKSPEVLDLTDLQKKGVLGRAQAIARENALPAKDFVNLAPKTNEANPQASSDGMLGFLNTLANASVPESSAQVPGLANPGNASRIDSGENFSGLKNKVEDLEYKLERLIERLAKIEEKFGKI